MSFEMRGHHRGYCSYISDLLGFDVDCRDGDGDGGDGERYDYIRDGLNYALDYLLQSQSATEKDEFWYRNTCHVTRRGQSSSRGLFEFIESYFQIDSSWEERDYPLFSDQPRPTSLDVLLANISVTLDGLPDLIAPQSIIDEVLDDIEDP